jgi:hypothetical protein
MLFGSGFRAAATAMGGAALEDAAKDEAAIMRYNASVTRAASQRKYEGAQTQKRLLVSRSRAVAGNSGLGVVDDPGYELMESRLTAEGELLAQSILWAGENQAIGQEYAAEVRENQGEAAKTAGFLTAAGDLVNAFGTYASDFGAPDRDQVSNNRRFG